MAILYTFTTNDPNNVGPFPPSVIDSDWFKSITAFHNSNNISAESSRTISIIFENETAVNSYLSTYTCVDAGLIADINTWKSAHGVSFTSNFYSLPDAGITTPSIL